MGIARWNPPEALSFVERQFVKRMARTGKLFAFLRQQRRAIFDDAFQDELAKMCRDTGAGAEAVAPGLMAMATLLQGHLGASDAESQQSRLLAQTQRLEVHRLFEALVGLDDHYAAGKLELGQRWMARSGVDPRCTVLVGDTDHDVEVARALGVRCLLVHSGHQSPARLGESGAEVVASLSAVHEVLASG